LTSVAHHLPAFFFTIFFRVRSRGMTLALRRSYCVIGLLLISGCGKSEKAPNWPDPVPVSGTVMYGGQPLNDARVTFDPIGTTPGQGASAFTDSAGKYVLQARWVDGKTKPGAIPGNYRVTISRMVNLNGEVVKPDPNAGPMTAGAVTEELPDQYSFNSQLTAEVSKDKGQHDFTLEKKK
jgi:hypothetical protein